MSESVKPRGFLTVEEYLALEETATVKHEYVGGHIYAMVGTTKRHHRIVRNIARKLHELNYEGFIGMEFSPSGTEEAALTLVKNLFGVE